MSQAFSPAVRAVVLRKYGCCRTVVERERLAASLGMDISQLYNFACRLGVPPLRDAARAVAGESELHLRRDDPDASWSAIDDEVIRIHWGRDPIESSAVLLDRSPTAIARRARQLRLRDVPRHYDAAKLLLLWLGISFAELRTLLEELDPLTGEVRPALHPCADCTGRVRIIVVPTLALARSLLPITDELSARGADRCFLADLAESVASLQDGGQWEADNWVSYEHADLCPYNLVGFGLRYSGGDQLCARLDPHGLAPSAHPESPDWMPERWRSELRQPALVA